MDSTSIPTILLTYLALPIISGAVSTAAYEFIKYHITYISSNWPSMKGRWKITTTIQHNDGSASVINETLEVKQQFFNRFSGVVVSPHKEAGKTIETQLYGEFLDKYHAVFYYKAKDRSKTDIGAGIIKVHQDHNYIDGGSANFGVLSGSGLISAKFSMERSNS